MFKYIGECEMFIGSRLTRNGWIKKSNKDILKILKKALLDNETNIIIYDDDVQLRSYNKMNGSAYVSVKCKYDRENVRAYIDDFFLNGKGLMPWYDEDWEDDDDNGQIEFCLHR